MPLAVAILSVGAAVPLMLLMMLFFSGGVWRWLHGINKRQAIDEAKKYHLFFTLINAAAITIIYKGCEWEAERRSEGGREDEKVWCDYCRKLRNMPLNTGTNTYTNLWSKTNRRTEFAFYPSYPVYIFALSLRTQWIIGRYICILSLSHTVSVRFIYVWIDVPVADFSLHKIV